MNDNPIIQFQMSGKSNQTLFILGVRHSHNPTDLQFGEILQNWNKFIELPSKKKIAFVELQKHSPFITYQESVEVKGESGAVAWLAKKNDVEIICPEPSDVMLREKLCSVFESKEVAYALVLQNLGSWFMSRKLKDFDDVLNHTLFNEKSYSQIYGFTPNLKWFNEQHHCIFKGQEIINEMFLSKVSDPRQSNTIVNKIISYKSSLRNQFLLNSCKEFWSTGYSIFLVYGKGHVLATIDDLTQMINKN